jgi:hypothetical protein
MPMMMQYKGQIHVDEVDGVPCEIWEIKFTFTHVKNMSCSWLTKTGLNNVVLLILFTVVNNIVQALLLIFITLSMCHVVL